MRTRRSTRAGRVVISPEMHRPTPIRGDVGKGRRRIWTDEEKAAVCAAYSAGCTRAQLQAEFHTSWTTIEVILIEAGLKD